MAEDSVTRRLHALEAEIVRLRVMLTRGRRILIQKGLSPREATLLVIIHNAGPVGLSELVKYGYDEKQRLPAFAERCILVRINKVRKKMKPFGVIIDSRQGVGYSLGVESSRRLEEFMLEETKL